jgi:hypothetical protein
VPTLPSAEPPSNTRVRLEGQRLADALAVPAVVAAKAHGKEAQGLIQSLIEALDLPVKGPLPIASLKEARRGTFRLQVGDHRFEVYPRSGGIKYRNAELYRLSERAPGESAPPDSALQPRAHGDLRRLAAARLIDLEQIDEADVHVSHQRSRSGERSSDGFKAGSLSTIDSRLDFTRRLGGLRVAGNGVRFVYGNDLRLYGCEIVWRSVRIPEAKEPLAVDRSGALAGFAEAVEEHARLGARVELLQAELVYADPGPTQVLTQLEPTYLFLYRVRTPIADRKDDFIVSKKRFLSIPALKATRGEGR